MDILQGAWCSHLHGQPPARLVVGFCRLQRLLQPHDRARLERARQLRGAIGVAGQQRLLDLLAVALGLRRRNDVDPLPERVERGARDAAAVLVVGRVIDQKRFEGLEKQARGIADARRALAELAHGAAQLGQHQFRAGHVVAAQQSALEFGDQQRAGGRRKRQQIFPQPFDGQPLGEHPGTDRFPMAFDSAAGLKN